MRSRVLIATVTAVAVLAGLATPAFATSQVSGPSPILHSEQQAAIQQAIERALAELRAKTPAETPAPTPAPAPASAAQPAAVPVPIVHPAELTAAVLPTPTCTATFDGSASSSWHAAANWDTNVVPGTTDVVCIPVGSDVAYTTGTSTVRALRVDGSLTVGGTELRVTEPSYAIALALSGGTLTLDSTLTVTQNFAWPDGTLTGAGALLVDTGAVATLSTGGTKSLSTTLDNDGTIAWSGGLIQMRSDLGGVGHLDNRNVFNVSSDQPASWCCGVTQPKWSNSGTITKSGAGTVTLVGLDIANTGTVHIAAGTLGLQAAGTTDTIAGTWTAASGATLRFLGGIYSATGVIDVARLELNGGNLAVTGAATFSADVVVITSSELTLSSPTANTHVGSLAVQGGSLDGAADITPTVAFSFTGGTIGGSGLLTIPTGMTSPWPTVDGKNLSRHVINLGTIDWTAGLLQMRSDLGGVGHLDNRGVLNVSSDQPASWCCGVTQAKWSNSGTITKTGAATLALTSLDLANTGTVHIAAGMLTLQAVGTDTIGGSWTADTGATLRFLGGDYSATGSIDVARLELNGANLAVTGAATFSADVLVLTAGGLTLSSPTAGTHVGSLAVQGGSLDGAADITPTVAFSFTGGTVAGSGLLTIPAGMTSPWPTGDTKDLSRHVINLGTIDWTAGLLQMRSDLGGVGHLDNRNVLNIAGGLTASWCCGATMAQITNTGTIAKTGSAGSTLGVGINVTNAGTLALSGPLTLGQNVVLAPTSRVAITIGNDVNGLLNVPGLVTLAGVLAITVDGGTLDPDLVVVDGGTMTGTFGSVSGATAAYDAANARVLVSPAPSNQPPLVSVVAQTFPESADTMAIVINGVGGDVPITLPVIFNDVTASSADYNNAPATVTVNPNSNTTLFVSVSDDALDEDDETFTVSVGLNTAPMTIVDNDLLPVAVIDDAQVTEGDTGTRNADFTVRLVDRLGLGTATPSGRMVQVLATTLDGTATALGDYTATARILTIPAGATSGVFSVPVAGDTTVEGGETFRVTLDQVTNVTVDQDEEAVGTIVDDDTPIGTGDIPSQLGAGGGAVIAALPGWGGQFDLGSGAGFELPVVTDQLNSRLGVASRLGSFANPLAALDAQLGAALDQLEARGCTVDWAEGGIGGRPAPPTAPDIVQVECNTTLADLAEAAGFTGDELNDQMAHVLDGLASALGLDATLTISGDLAVHLVLGVDETGFYVGNASALTLTVDATGTVSGTATIAGTSGLTVTGSGTAHLDVKLTANGGAARLRTAALANPGAFLRPSATGTATLGLSGALNPLTFQWGSTHTLTVAANGVTDLTTAATLDAALTLPGIALNLHGTFDGTTWHLHGVGDVGTAYTLDGFTLDNLVSDATITASSFAGSFDAAARVNLGNTTPTVVALHATFAGAALHGTAHVTLADQTYGTLPPLVFLDGFSLDVTLDANVQAHTAAITATVHADTLVLLPQPAAAGVVPQGAATATGVTGTVDEHGNISLHADTMSGRIAGAIQFSLTNVNLTFGPDATDPLFTITDTVVATVPDLGNLAITLTGFHANRNGTFGASTVGVAATNLAETIGIGGILPFDLHSATVVFPNHDNLDTFNVTATGSFNFPAMDALPFDPIIEIAGNRADAGEAFSFSIAVDSFASGAVRPLNFGPIKLGFTGLQVGTATIAADLTLGEYVNGTFSGFGGTMTIGGAVDVTTGAATVNVAGTFPEAGTLELTGRFSISANLSPEVEIQGAALDFALRVRFGTAFTITGPTLTGASVERVAAHFGNFMTLFGSGHNLNFHPAPGESLVELPLLGVEFDAGAPLLAGWRGDAANIAIGADLTPKLMPGFGVTVHPPPGSHLGLPDFLPLHIDALGIKFPNIDLANIPAGGVAPADLAAFTFRISGGIDATPQWPISMSVDDLEVDFGKLMRGEFPITNLSGFHAGVAPFELVPGFKVGGELALKQVDVDSDAGPGVHTEHVFYGQVSGTFEYQGFGAGIDLVVSQYGPVLAQLKVPVGVPIDGGVLGGILLTSVTGGVNFGGSAFPDPQSPLDILHNPAFNTDFPVNATTIHDSVEPAVQQHTLTWSNAFTVALSGTLTHAAAPGVINGQVTLGMNVGFGATPKVKLIGTGNVNFYGMPFAGAALLIDLGDPIAPRFDAAFETPSVGNPLSFLLPAQAQFEVSLDTKGIVAGVAAGVQTFVTQVADGALTTGGALYNGAFDALASRLERDHLGVLAKLLLDTNGDGTLSGGETARVITRAFVVDRLLGRHGQPSLLSFAANGLPASPAIATKTVQALLPDLFDAAGDALASNQFAISAADAVSAFANVLNQSLRNAGAAFLAQFDPKFILRGAIQPVIFGIPLGQPDQRVEVILAKDGISFGFDTSMHDIAVKLSSLVFPVLGGAATNLFSLGFADHLGLTAQLPISGVVQRLLTGQGLGASDFDPVHGAWAVELRGGLSWNGFNIGQMTGLLVAPGDSALLDAHIQKMWLDPSQPVDPNRIPIQVEQHYNDLLARGGLLLTGRLLAQRLITDPVGLLSSLNLPFPTDPLQIPAWVTAVGQHLSVLDQPAQVQLYIPGLAGLGTPNFNAPTELGRLGITQTGQALANSLNSYFASAYIEGTWNGKLLSLPIGNGTMTTTASGVQVSTQIPMLGLTSTFGLDMHPTTGTGGVVNLPRATSQITLDSTQLNTALTKLGLPALFSSVGTASATFRAFTPGYDTTSTDPLLRRGGVELSGHMAITGLVGDGAFTFSITPPATATGTPDFVATATVANLPALAGVQIHNALVTVRKVGTNVTIEVDGRATILGVDARVRGTLASNLTGTLTVTFDGAPPSLGGFGISGGIRFTLTQGAGGLTATLGFNGQVTFPAWLATASGQASVAGSGSFSTTGDFDLQLTLTNFAFGPGRVVRIVGTGGGAATFHLLRAGGVTTVSVDGQLNLGATSGLPLFAINGTLSSNGIGTLNTQFSSAGLNLSGFLVKGGASLSFNQGSFTMAATATVTIPGLVTNANVSGSMNQNGIQSLTVGAGSLTLPPLTLTNTTASLVRTSTSPFVYALQVGTTASIPNVVNGLAISGTLNSQGFGSLSLTATSLSLFGFNLTNGAFSIVRAAGGSSLSVQGKLTFLGQSLNVTQANLAIGAVGGITGNVTVGLAGNAPLSLGGWNVTGTFRMAFAGTTATFAIPSATVTIPGSGSVTITNASLNTAGLGTITVSTGTGLHLGGASSPFVVTGSFTLSRLGSPAVTTFSGTNVTVAWTGVTSFSAPTFTIASNGLIDVTITSKALTLGAFTLDLGTIHVHIGANGTGAQLQLGASSLAITGVGTFAVPAVNVAISGLFSITLASASLSLSALDVFGRLVFERVIQGGTPVFRLAVRDTTAGVSPRVRVGQFASVDLNEFFIASNATFSVNASVNRIGPDALSIRNASISLHKTGAALTTVGLDVDGGALHFNGGLGNPVQLPDITINTSAAFNKVFNAPAINLGPAFKTSNASVRLGLSGGVMTLALQSPSSLTVLAGSVGVTLNSFNAASNGTFDGSVTGALKIAGLPMSSSVTLDVSLRSGVLRMTLPANRGVNVNLGFLTTKFSGFVESNGNYDFSGTAALGFSVLGFSITGTGTFHLADSGFSGALSGTGCAPILGCLTTTGSITKGGLVRASINGLNYTFQL